MDRILGRETAVASFDASLLEFMVMMVTIKRFFCKINVIRQCPSTLSVQSCRAYQISSVFVDALLGEEKPRWKRHERKAFC